MDDGRASLDTPIYRGATRQLREGIVTVDADMEISGCNSVAEERLRAVESDLLGESIWMLFPEAAGTVAKTEIEDAIASGQQGIFQRFDPGALAWSEVRVYPVGDGLSLFIADPSDDGSQQRDVQLFAASEEQTGVGGWKIDLPSETLHVSDEVLRLRGLPLDYDLTLEEGITFYHPEDRPIIRGAVDRLRTRGETYDLELREVTDDGEIYWVRTTGVAEYDDDGAITALRGVYRDITDRKEKELKLQRRTREVERQNERLDDFASLVSHDLRNPLNVAQGRLELARREVESEHFDAIEDAIARMDALIGDLLDLARHGREVSDPEPVALARIVEQCWGAVEQTDAELMVGTDATVLAEEGRLRQLFGNLLRNAIEHAGDGVTVAVGDLDGGFYVEDDGPGIPPDQREHVMDSGYTTSSNGTGFGLAIVREIAEAHHWGVRITERSNGGARFEFTGVETV